VHVGVAQYRARPLTTSTYDVWARELTPDVTISWLWTILEFAAASEYPPVAVAYETFRVRSGTPLGGSSLEVVQMIGAIKAIATRYRAPLTAVTPQTRSVHTVRLSTRSNPWAGVGDHAHDAQAVGAAALALDPEDYVPHKDATPPPFAWPSREGAACP
jgi:hypothetical protein